ncbi:hypothetical protein MHM93_16600 [Pseudoalteromonas sp. MM17-2]|uniref:hypothetical protein n=1 Tax=Pseudoalteromonas sp. MM17-2 TaxID=2917753 RepID=UPI001EF45B77|nr:hypothetical protein [Pseudoalteromonas sp. MM17-2]MCG7545804.1 hypothetical protein [Pseudoalteromonas sp. MM17-2]
MTKFNQLRYFRWAICFLLFLNLMNSIAFIVSGTFLGFIVLFVIDTKSSNIICPSCNKPWQYEPKLGHIKKTLFTGWSDYICHNCGNDMRGT